MTSRPVVASIGGSLIAGEDMGPDRFQDIVEAIEARVDQPLAIVVGGGYGARRYIGVARALGLDEAGLDHLGITITRANAWLLVAAFGQGAYPHPARDLEEATIALGSHHRVCMGGTHPGHTTDAVAAMLAERTGAERLVIATNVDGVYTADPRKEDGAELLETLTADELVTIAGQARRAGSSGVVDPLAAQIIARSGLSTRVCSGEDVVNLAAALGGGPFEGSTIAPAPD